MIKSLLIRATFLLLRIFALLPLTISHFFGKQFGLIIYYLNIRRKVVEANLLYCFPNLSKEQRNHLCKKHYIALGVGILELASAWYKPYHRLKSKHRITGLEHYKKAQQNGQGILFIGYHVTSLELAVMFISKHLDFAAFYRPNDNSIIDKEIQKGRNKHFKSLARSDIRSIVKWLRKGNNLLFLPDQDFAHQNTVFAPFFDKPMATLNSPIRMAKLGNAIILPLCYFRDEQGITNIEILPNIELTDDIVRDCSQMNQILQESIEKAPEQYYWVHRRFKTLPQGHKSIYK